MLATIATILWSKYHSLEQAEAYKSLIAGDVGLLSVEFNGQIRSIKIEDQTVIADFENAFGNKKKSLTRSGIAYTGIFLLKSGAKIKTDVYFYDDKSGFSMANYSRLSAGDPAYVDVDFQSQTSQKTQVLIGNLLAKKSTN